MESLYSKITPDMCKELLYNAPFCGKVEAEDMYVLRLQSVRMLLVDFIETHLEKYEFKENS